MTQNKGDPTQAFWARKFVAGNGTAGAPSIGFNADPDTGFYLSATAQIKITIGSSNVFSFDGTGMWGNTVGSSHIKGTVVASATVPTLCPANGDTDTGIGSAGADALSLIAGAKEGLRLTEASNFVIASAATSANVGLTAHVGSAQGSGPILASYNVYDTVATAGDCGTLPAVFEVGTLIYVKNGAAANSMDVFPASGDDAGAGANAAVAIAAGNFKVFMGTTANSTWEQIMGGTA